MGFFNQLKYSTETDNIDKDDKENDNIEKGHKNVIQVDIAKFEEICKNFKDKKDLKIKNLTGRDKEDYDLAVSYVQLLYGTSYYSHLFDRVKKIFKSINNVAPGTVGAYFAGCLIKDESSNLSQGCSVNCAGSMPLPKDENGWSFCDKAVLLAEKGDNGYVFSVIKPANSQEEMDPAYLFIESSSLNEFSGFSKDEKEHLRAYGYEKVKLIGYKSNTSELTYSEIYNEPKGINDIKHRHSKSKYESKSHKDEQEETDLTIFFVLFIFLLLILIFCAYKYYKNL